MLKVHIKDFESISDLSLDIKGFTVVVGRNNLGKSAIIRAIDAALTNRTGNEFIRWGKLRTEVDLKHDTLSVEWKKGEKTVYKVNDQPYSGLNRSIPKPILDSGFKQIEIGNDKCNPLIAHQFKELFLIHESGSTVTEVLSKIYNINVINDADAICQKNLRSTKSLIKTREMDLTKLAEQIEKFKNLDDIKRKNEFLNKLTAKKNLLIKEIAEIEQFNTEKNRLSELTNKLKPITEINIPNRKNVAVAIIDYQRFVDTHEKFHESLKILKKIRPATFITFPNLDKLVSCVEEKKSLESLIKKFKESATIFNSCKQLVTEFKKFNQLKEKEKKSQEYADLISGLINLQNNFLVVARSVKSLIEENKTITDNLAKSDIEYKQFKTCPLCKKTL